METENNQKPIFANNNQKTLAIIVGAIIIVALVAFFVNRNVATAPKVDGDSEVAVEEGCQEGNLFNTVTGKPCPEAKDATGASAIKSTTTKKNAPAAAGTSYDTAVKQFGSNTIVFGNDCNIGSDNPSFTAGTRILLNNASTQTATISIGEKVVTLRPYHYATYKLASAGEVAVMCNGEIVTTVTVK